MKRYEAGCGARTKLIASCVLVAAMTASLPAGAETIFLTCTGPGAPYKFSVDLTKNTVDGHQATITATEIFWEDRGDVEGDPGATGITHFSIDRTTGILTVFDQIQKADGSAYAPHSFTFPCTAGSAPATKF